MKQETKRQIFTLIKIFIFVVCLALIIEGLSLTIFSNENALTFKNNYSSAYAFKTEPDNTIQIAGVGNSNLYSGMAPQVIWKEYGYASTDMGSNRQTPERSLQFIKEIRDTQSPKIIIVESDMFYDDEIEEQNVDNKIDAVFDFLDPDNFQNNIESHITVFTYHDRWKNKKANQPIKNSHGYKYNTLVATVNITDSFMQKTDKVDPVIQKYEKSFAEMVEYCNENDMQIILTTFPAPASWDYARHNGIQQMADKYDVPYIDLNLKLDEMGIDGAKDFRDVGNHLNFAGATKASKYLGQYIKDNYDIKCQWDNPEYEYWVTTNKEFYQTAKVTEE